MQLEGWQYAVMNSRQSDLLYHLFLLMYNDIPAETTHVYDDYVHAIVYVLDKL